MGSHRSGPHPSGPHPLGPPPFGAHFWAPPFVVPKFNIQKLAEVEIGRSRVGRTRRPTLIKSTATWGTRALAKREPNAVKSYMSLASSNKGRRCSVVIPEGPLAAPRRDERRFRANNCSSRSNMAIGSYAVSSSGSGSRGRSSASLTYTGRRSTISRRRGI